MKLLRDAVLSTMTLTLLLLVVGVQIASAQTETVLSSFTGGAGDGQIPHGRLVMDSSGNLYGTTFSGGTYNMGTVFKLSPGSPWTKKVLHNFGSVGDGAYPWGGLTLVGGNLYGTTSRGGISDYGTLFELTPGISWTLTGLYSFTGGTDGYYPYDYEGLATDSSGNFYGTTLAGGTAGLGTVFELIPPVPPSLVWEKKILHNFGSTGDGYYPYGSLLVDSSGHVYGTTSTGGAHGHGTVFKLSPGTPWSESLLYSFVGGLFDGASPMSSLVMDSFGNLYGTTSGGGAHGYGYVFELLPGAPWKESLLHTFLGGTGDGIYPNAGLVMDSSGNLYGTTQVGGAHSLGIVFKLSVLTSWAETVLHNFAGGTGVNGDGACPYIGDLIMDGTGNLYGTTYIGGTNAVGTVFKIVP